MKTVSEIVSTEIMITTKTLLYKHLKCIVRPHDMHKEV